MYKRPYFTKPTISRFILHESFIEISIFICKTSSTASVKRIFLKKQDRKLNNLDHL